MSRAKAMTLGEAAYNESLRQLDPGYVNPNFPQWPKHLTQGQLRHWHTAVGPSIRRTKPHYRRMRACDLPAVEVGQLEVYSQDDSGRWMGWHTQRPTLFKPEAKLWVRCNYYNGGVEVVPTI